VSKVVYLDLVKHVWCGNDFQIAARAGQFIILKELNTYSIVTCFGDLKPLL